MNQTQFDELIRQGPIILDGATGTYLQAADMPPGVCPETWVLEHADVLTSLQRAYFKAGSQIVFTCTFGANRPKLQHYSLNTDIVELNRRAAAISIALRDELRQADPASAVFVAGELGPTGCFLFPSGDMTLDQLVEIYREQVRGLLAAGVDLFTIETMVDLAEVRAAVLAIQAECDLPVIASLTYDVNGRTLAGNTPLECLLTLAGLGVAVSGINCSFGPETLGKFINPLRKITPIPLMLKPNAGLPALVDGRAVFPLDPDAFAAVVKPLAGDGVLLLGGCCGTGPAHITRLCAVLDDGEIPASAFQAALPAMICSARKSWLVEHPHSLPIVECADADSLIDDVYAVLAGQPPAVILDLDAAADKSGLPALLEAFQQLQAMLTMPFIFRSKNQQLLELLLYHYCGRAGLVSPAPGRSFGALVLQDGIY